MKLSKISLSQTWASSTLWLVESELKHKHEGKSGRGGQLVWSLKSKLDIFKFKMVGGASPKVALLSAN